MPRPAEGAGASDARQNCLLAIYLRRRVAEAPANNFDTHSARKMVAFQRADKLQSRHIQSQPDSLLPQIISADGMSAACFARLSDGKSRDARIAKDRDDEPGARSE